MQYLRICALFALSALVVAPSTASANPWARAYNAKTKARFIPVELWTGRRWSGGRRIAMKGANLVFGGGSKRITGPRRWRNPHNGTTYLVYKRTNGPKTQFFALRGRMGLGRVYDSRRPRYCTPGFKFPLGTWRQGETRTVRQSCWTRSGRSTRTLTIRIERIDFVHDGVPHSLRFRWIVDGGGPNRDNSYIYSPGRGMVGYIGH